MRYLEMFKKYKDKRLIFNFTDRPYGHQSNDLHTFHTIQ